MKRALVAAMLSALATAAVLATVGFGAGTTATTAKKKHSRSAQTTQSGPPKTMKQVYDAMQAQRAAQDKKLADALGVTVDQLTAAQDKLKQDRLDAAVKANQLTDAQRTAILACDKAPLTCDRSNLPAGGPGGRHRDGMRGDRGTFAADLAKALGLETAKVQSALDSTRPAPPTGGGMPGRGGFGHGPGGHGPGGPDGDFGPGMGGGGPQGPPPGI